jgi:hypothetical protein
LAPHVDEGLVLNLVTQLTEQISGRAESDACWPTGRREQLDATDTGTKKKPPSAHAPEGNRYLPIPDFECQYITNEVVVNALRTKRASIAARSVVVNRVYRMMKGT